MNSSSLPMIVSVKASFLGFRKVFFSETATVDIINYDRYAGAKHGPKAALVVEKIIFSCLSNDA